MSFERGGALPGSFDRFMPLGNNFFLTGAAFSLLALLFKESLSVGIVASLPFKEFAD